MLLVEVGIPRLAARNGARISPLSPSRAAGIALIWAGVFVTRQV